MPVAYSQDYRMESCFGGLAMNGEALSGALEGWAAVRDLEGATFRRPTKRPKTEILKDASGWLCFWRELQF